MKQLYYCGINSYNQFSVNDTYPKTINDLIPILHDEIEDVQCTHRLVIVKIKNDFTINGMINELKTDFSKIVKSPINSESFLSTDNSIFVADKFELWKSDYSNDWTKVAYDFESKNEELWRNGGYIKKLCKTNDSIYCLLSEGSIWKLKENGKLDVLYSPDVDKAVDIASGFEHTLILTESGCVLSFGIGSRGQLGHGDLNLSKDPAQISSLVGLKITRIAAGGWHSCAVSDSNDLYTWGWNNFGQLGCPSDDYKAEDGIGLTAEPIAVDFSEDVRDVSCGSRHTVVVTVKDNLYATGWNEYGQLGINETPKVFSLTKVESNPGKKQLICGPWSTIVLS